MVKKAGQPLVGIGLITYNRPAGLTRMVESLLAQTHENLVILLCDNASPGPETQKICEAFAKADKRVIYKRHSQNLGMSGNFKAAYELAGEQGVEYFLWASDDDYFHPEYVGYCLELLAKNPTADAAIPTPYMGNDAGVRIYDYPGFSRFTNVGLRGLRRWWYLWKLLWEPIVKAKGTLPYLLFRYETMAVMMAKYSPKQLNIWGGDIPMVYAYIKDHEIVGSDKYLMEKNFPTARTNYWFPLAWSYQPPLRRVWGLYELLKVAADSPAEKLQITMYILGLYVFWLTVGYPARAVSLVLRKVRDSINIRW